jgi:hypothetical protein
MAAAACCGSHMRLPVLRDESSFQAVLGLALIRSIIDGGKLIVKASSTGRI